MGTASPPGATWILEIHLNQQHKPCMNPGARKEVSRALGYQGGAFPLGLQDEVELPPLPFPCQAQGKGHHGFGFF